MLLIWSLFTLPEFWLTLHSIHVYYHHAVVKILADCCRSKNTRWGSAKHWQLFEKKLLLNGSKTWRIVWCVCVCVRACVRVCFKTKEVHMVTDASCHCVVAIDAAVCLSVCHHILDSATNSQIIPVSTPTPLSRLLDMSTVPQQVPNFPAFYGALAFTTVFPGSLDLSLFWTRTIQSTSPILFLKDSF